MAPLAYRVEFADELCMIATQSRSERGRDLCGSRGCFGDDCRIRATAVREDLDQAYAMGFLFFC